MKNPLVLTLIDRPEMAPEYAQKTTQNGQSEDLTSRALLDESLSIFLFQQEEAHKRGLKTTIEMTYASLFCDDVVALAKRDHEKYGDEIALTLLGLPCKQFYDKYKTKDFCIWMFSKEDKEAIIDDAFGLFYEKFGFYPASTGSYYLDAYCLNYIKKKYPSVVCAVATCWEEGVKCYHTTNNSWYTFIDGGPWAPWVPSKVNSALPAANKADDCGIVCIPHLSRDLMACFDGNGSNFGTHPQNVLRGMIYEDNELPYFFNLVDMYREQARYNNGRAYNMMFVGPGWLNKAGRWEQPYSLLKKSYCDGLDYYAKLKKNGQLIDMTMAEYAAYYRKEHPSYLEPEVALWRDVLYGSNKEYFWYYDPFFRACLDFNQGGAMICLNPYVGKLDLPVGIGTGNAYNASYPYIIEANYRAGFFTHYAGQGTLKSCVIRYQGQECDLALERTLASYQKVGDDIELTTNPFEVVFKDLSFHMQSVYRFKKGTGEIVTTRRILDDLGGKSIEIEDYLVGCYGINEYSDDMSCVTLEVEGNQGKQSLQYAYKMRQLVGSDVSRAIIPPVNTIVEMGGDPQATVKAEEGIAFSPMFRLSVSQVLSSKGEFTSWLKVKKAR
jgi:hypothetical protein